LICVFGLTYDAVVANEADVAEPEIVALMLPVTVRLPEITASPVCVYEPLTESEPVSKPLSIIIIYTLFRINIEHQ
jgi:hypothetical protein